jgi:hypothetical protein
VNIVVVVRCRFGSTLVVVASRRVVGRTVVGGGVARGFEGRATKKRRDHGRTVGRVVVGRIADEGG